MSVNRQLSRAVQTIRVLNSTAAGTTNANTASVDTLNPSCSGVRFVALMGALTATQVTSLKIQDSADNATWNDVQGSQAGPMLDAQSNLVLISEIYKPLLRYMRAVVVRGTANAAIDGVLAELYLPDRLPVNNEALDASVAFQSLNYSPPDGTAGATPNANS